MVLANPCVCTILKRTFYLLLITSHTFYICTYVYVKKPTHMRATNAHTHAHTHFMYMYRYFLVCRYTKHPYLKGSLTNPY